MGGNHTIRDGTIATVIGGLLVAGILALFSRESYEWMLATLLSGVVFLMRPVAVPLTPLLILIAAAASLVWLAAHQLWRSAATETHEQRLVRIDGQLESHQHEILRRLGAHDGNPLPLEALQRDLRVSALRLSSEIDVLETHDLAYRDQGFFDVPVLRITSLGRDLLMFRKEL